MLDPDPILAPVMLPLIVPKVQTKVLGTLAVKAIFGPDPLQVVAVGAVVITGIGLTVTVIVKGVPAQEPVVAVGVTMY